MIRVENGPSHPNTSETSNKKVFWRRLHQSLRVILLGVPMVLTPMASVDADVSDTFATDISQAEHTQNEAAIAPENAALYQELSQLIRQFKSGEKQPLIDYLSQINPEQTGLELGSYLRFTLLFRHQDGQSPRTGLLAFPGLRQVPQLTIQIQSDGISIRDDRGTPVGQEEPEGGTVSTLEDALRFLEGDIASEAELVITLSESRDISPTKSSLAENQLLGVELLSTAAQQRQEKLAEYGSLLNPFSPLTVTDSTKNEVTELVATQGWTVDSRANEIRVRRDVRITASAIEVELTVGENPFVYAGTLDVVDLDTDPTQVMRVSERLGFRLTLAAQTGDTQLEATMWRADIVLLVPRGEVDAFGGATVAVADEMPLRLPGSEQAKLATVVEGLFR